MIFLLNEIINKMKTYHNIGFEVLKKDQDVVVLKRVLPKKHGKRQKNIEMSLPKLSIHYFDTDDLQRLQKIALRLSETKSKMAIKNSIRYKILSLFKFG